MPARWSTAWRVAGSVTTMRSTVGARRSHRLAAPMALLAALAPAATADAAQRRSIPRLQAFPSCTALVDYARTNAGRFGGGTGVPTRALPPPPQVLTAPPSRAFAEVTAPPPAAAAPAAGPGREAVPFSSTNVQETGVDEPDIVKTDGRRIVAIADAQLLVIDVTGPAPVLRGRLRLEGTGHQLLVRDDTALVTATVASAPASAGALRPAPASPRQAAEPAPPAATAPTVPPPPQSPAPPPAPSISRPIVSRQATRLTEVSLDDPAAPTVRRSLTLDGTLVDARLTQGTARVVVTSPPRAVEAEEVEDAGVRTWVPKTVLRSRVSGRIFERGVAPCDDIRRPRAFSGLDLLSVLTIDLDRGLFAVDRDAILAGAQTVYASPDSLYVASRPYSRAVEAGTGVPEGVRTQIHRYDARGQSATTYRATGDVPGFVLNQYSMSEHQDRLRVATTSEPLWFPDGRATESESRVTVLGEDAGRLNTVGSVGGLGKGERIYAVRFLGERGYVVTFRRTDPLYTLDLSDPTAPRVRGELKILGYSAYLHPVGEDRLLGVGQDATQRGQVTGAQLSLFDVSDAAAPKRVAQAPLGSGTSTQAEFDPHAFLFWDPARLSVIPLERYGSADERFTGAIGFRVGRDALAEVGRLAHPARQGAGVPPIGRSLVIGARLYTLSYDGLQAANLADLVPLGFTPFSQLPGDPPCSSPPIAAC